MPDDSKTMLQLRKVHGFVWLPGNQRYRVVLRCVGVTTILVAGLGLQQTLGSLVRMFRPAEVDGYVPLVGVSFVAALLVILLLCGVTFVALFTQLRYLFCIAIMSEIGIVVVFASGALGHSNTTRTGVVAAGMMPQLLSLFIVWAPLLIFWTHHKMYGLPLKHIRRGRCPVCGYDMRTTPHRCTECGTPTALWNPDSSTQ